MLCPLKFVSIKRQTVCFTTNLFSIENDLCSKELNEHDICVAKRKATPAVQSGFYDFM